MKSWKPVAVIVVLFLCACTPRYTVVTPELRTQMMADLKAGKPNLTCDLECVFSWTSNFRRMIALHNASQWEALAELVMQVGHGKDISYYFLGKAAEGLGYYDAAAKYYQTSLQLYNGPHKLHHCRDVPGGDYCGGLNLGIVLPKQIASVQAQGRAQSQADGDIQPLGTAASSSAGAETIGPYKYKCEDGRIFTIIFIKQTGEIAPAEARLVFEKTNSTEILINQRGASGCSYANGNYWYSEHQGNISLLDMTKKRKDYWMPCREIIGNIAQPADSGLQAKTDIPSASYWHELAEKWVGDTPTGGMRNSSSLLDNPRVMKALVQTLGKQRTKMLTTIMGVGVIYRVDDNMAFGAICTRGKGCSGEFTLIFINLQDGSVQACWQDVNDYWLSPGGAPRRLREGYCSWNGKASNVNQLSKMFREQNSNKAK